MKVSFALTRLAAAGAVALSLGLAAAPASADVYSQRPASIHQEVRAGERMKHDRELMWRDIAYRHGRSHEHCLARHHEVRGGFVR